MIMMKISKLICPIMIVIVAAWEKLIQRSHIFKITSIIRATNSWIAKLRDPNADKLISHFCAGRQKMNINIVSADDSVFLNIL